MGACVSSSSSSSSVSVPKDEQQRIGKKPSAIKQRRTGSFRARFRNLALFQQQLQGGGFVVEDACDGGSKRRSLATILLEDKAVHASHGSKEEFWFDAEATSLSSDSDDEFLSVLGDTPSRGNSVGSQAPRTPRPTFATLKEGMGKVESNGELISPGCSKARVSFSSLLDDHLKAEEKSGSCRKMEPPRNSSCSVAPVSDSSTEMDGAKHGNKAEFEGCLPCLINTVVSEKKHLQRRKSSRVFSFKRRASFDGEDVVKRPLAGFQVPEGGWSKVCPSTFKLRSQHYLKDRKKLPASTVPIYEAVGVDVFLSSRKIDHISRFIDISHLGGSDAVHPKENFPALLIFNIQVPLYTASVFPAEANGEGLSLVFYYRLAEDFVKEGPSYLKDMLTKFLNDDHEKIKGLVSETSVSFRERLKIVARVVNPEEIHLSATEKKLVVSYNEKPVLSRPQHLFFKGPNYFEIDLDVHRFNFIARKAVEAFRERLKLCILDIGLTIQGNKPEELPEYILCCARVSKLNISDFKYLSIEEEARTHP